MIVRVDEQLSHALAPWLAAQFGIEAYSVDHLGLARSEDAAIFRAARNVGAVVMTKDSDFVDLLHRFGPPPQILLIAVRNSRNSRLKAILSELFPAALALLRSGEPLVQIMDRTAGEHT